MRFTAQHTVGVGISIKLILSNYQLADSGSFPLGHSVLISLDNACVHNPFKKKFSNDIALNILPAPPNDGKFKFITSFRQT